MATMTLAGLAESYARTERLVQEVLASRCAGECAVCRRVCCREDICHESQESAWLRFVRKSLAPTKRYSKARGWLTRHGCRLPAGRPPVCYAFFCDAILESLRDPARRYPLAVAGQALNTVGRRAAGSDHLVVIEDLERLTPPRIQRLADRLAQAREAIQAANEVLSGEDITPERLALFRTISRPPADLAARPNMSV